MNIKKEFLELISTIFLVNLISVILAALFSQYWPFNLFDQFWIHYFLVSLLTLIFYLIAKDKLKVIISILILIFCIPKFITNKNTNLVNSSALRNIIYYQNINSSNTNLNILTENIMKINADLVGLVEVTSDTDIYLKKNLSKYKFYYSLPREDNYGFGIYSKYPIKVNYVYEWDMGIPLYILFEIEKVKQKIYLLHLPPPLWQEAYEIQNIVLDKIAKEIRQNKNEAYVIVGDFNMTTWSNIYQDFFKKLDSSFYSEKKLNDGTWPSILPNVISLPIDHILSNRKYNMEIGSASGSDHQSLIIRMN